MFREGEGEGEGDNQANKHGNPMMFEFSTLAPKHDLSLSSSLIESNYSKFIELFNSFESFDFQSVHFILNGSDNLQFAESILQYSNVKFDWIDSSSLFDSFGIFNTVLPLVSLLKRSVSPSVSPFFLPFSLYFRFPNPPSFSFLFSYLLLCSFLFPISFLPFLPLPLKPLPPFLPSSPPRTSISSPYFPNHLIMPF